MGMKKLMFNAIEYKLKQNSDELNSEHLYFQVLLWNKEHMLIAVFLLRLYLEPPVQIWCMH